MRIYLYGLVVLASLTVMAVPAHAAFMTGKVLLGLCTSSKADDQFACENYIAGVIDYHILVRSLGTAPSVDFCLPRTVRMQQIKQVVQVYLTQRPEQHGFVAAPAVALALYGTFPCARKK
jgi:hypothetical protein